MRITSPMVDQTEFVAKALERRKSSPAHYLIIKIRIPGVGECELAEEYLPYATPVAILNYEDGRVADESTKRSQIIDIALQILRNPNSRGVDDSEDWRLSKATTMRLEINLTGDPEDLHILRWSIVSEGLFYTRPR